MLRPGGWRSYSAQGKLPTSTARDATVSLTSSEEIETELKEKDVFVFELANDEVCLVCIEKGMN